MLRFKEFIQEKENIDTGITAYHGSGRHFDSFDQKHSRIKNDYFGGGIGYFTDNHDVAKTYARSSAKETKTPHVYHTSLHFKKLFDVDHEFSGDKLKHILPKDTESFARGAGLLKLSNAHEKHRIIGDLQSGKTKLTGHQVFHGLSNGMNNTAKARQHLIKKGYDGLRYNGGVNMNQETKHNVYIPYDHNAIKIHKVEKF